MAGEQQTGTRDEHFNLISVLYHCLEGASTCEQYIRDAEQTGDQELVQFFRDWQEEQHHFAERAKNLMGSRLLHARAGVGREAKSTSEVGMRSGGNERDDIVDEQSKESFPASDAPAHY